MRKKIYLLLIAIAVIIIYTVYRHYFWHPHLPPAPDYSHPGIIREKELMKIVVNYEDTSILKNTFSVSSEKSFSGRHSCKLSKSTEYGSCLSLPVSSITNFNMV